MRMKNDFNNNGFARTYGPHPILVSGCWPEKAIGHASFHKISPLGNSWMGKPLMIQYKR